ncbi:MAG: hypothetical protein KC731_02870 [Myxococcales bacterium]|nr:hypothetical protein [Myxococcales bacterium]
MEFMTATSDENRAASAADLVLEAESHGAPETLMALETVSPPGWISDDWLSLGSCAASIASSSSTQVERGAWRRVAILGYERGASTSVSPLREREAFHRYNLIVEEGASQSDKYRSLTWFVEWLRAVTSGESPEEFSGRVSPPEPLVLAIHAAVAYLKRLAAADFALPDDALAWVEATPGAAKDA